MITRRQFVSGAVAGGAAATLGVRPEPAAAEPAPETPTLRLSESPILCLVPQYVAEGLLRSEGFTDVRYINYPRETQTWAPDVLVSGEVDLSLSFGPTNILRIDAGAPIVMLAGSHNGCVELFGGRRVRSTRDLKGKTVAVSELRSDQHIFTSMFVAHVGLDPRTDINWIVRPFDESVDLLASGTIDAVMSGPPFSDDMRARKIGHVLVNTTTDKPWSQHVCCMVTASRDFVRRHPVATKRALRAILKALDLCAREPAKGAQALGARRLAPRYDDALRTVNEMQYGRWRAFDPEASVRFYSLWLRDVGMIKSIPQKIIAEGTDWRFLNELKKELKG
jgi:NitT/TauT family transport system substrate-binding protein